VTPVLTAGQEVGKRVVAAPVMLGVGGRDLLVVDEENSVWRWTPAGKEGQGTASAAEVPDSASWGNDVRAIDTFCTVGDCSLYRLYVVDASERQVLAYSPRADGTGYSAPPDPRLATARDVSKVTDLYIDGDIWMADGGVIERFVSGRDDGWRTEELADQVLRPTGAFDLVTSGTPRRQGRIYGWDRANGRIVAFDKADGGYIEQYRVGGLAASWKDLRGLYILPGIEDGPATAVWIDRDRLLTALLEPVIGGAASPSPSGSPGASGSTQPSAAASAQP
jgi:hypothetical protein